MEKNLQAVHKELDGRYGGLWVLQMHVKSACAMLGEVLGEVLCYELV